ncbi:Hypothetical predicted protein [Podarcis lilfordi]|uniref:Uncharacterized protein n=1 Tax=Podarcis lilfordi TaxID=74358 RepID=A0AA35JX62_9SAUR|nr:Hypothetical predicted protein [Podarcis lilfordi]
MKFDVKHDCSFGNNGVCRICPRFTPGIASPELAQQRLTAPPLLPGLLIARLPWARPVTPREPGQIPPRRPPPGTTPPERACAERTFSPRHVTPPTYLFIYRLTLSLSPRLPPSLFTRAASSCPARRLLRLVTWPRATPAFRNSELRLETKTNRGGGGRVAAAALRVCARARVPACGVGEGCRRVTVGAEEAKPRRRRRRRRAKAFVPCQRD